MHTNSITFPALLPGLYPQPTDHRSKVREKRDFRFPELLGAVKTRLSTRTDSLSAERLQQTARQGRRIVLGTLETPYEPLILGGAPLAALRQFEDLEIVITTRSAEISEELDLLTELDVRHAVTIDFLVTPGELACPDLQDKLRAIASLAAEGLTTRLVAAGLPDIRPAGVLPANIIPANGHNGIYPREAMLSLRRLFEAARKSRVFDVTVCDKTVYEKAVYERTVTGKTNGWAPIVHRLRMEYGFPRQLPGRG